jgi:hypothetical protein
VLRHRVLPQDPLAVDSAPGWLPALLEEGSRAAAEPLDTIDLL